MRPAIAAGLLTFSVFADCPDGGRNATPAELEFHKKVLTAMADAFPAAPEGFKQPAKFVVAEPRLSMCKGTPLGDFRMELSLSYERSTVVRERDTPEYAGKQALEAKMQALTKLTPEAQAKYDEAKKAYDAAYAPYRAAVKANNKEEAARLRKEVDATYAQMTDVSEQHRRAMLPESNRLAEERNKINATIRAKYSDPVTVSISVNDRYGKLEGKGWMLGTLAKPAVKAQKIVYQFCGPEAEVEKFLPLVDQAKLKTLLAM